MTIRWLAVLTLGVSWLSANDIPADEFKRVNERSPTPMSPWDIVLLADTELVRNVAEWISEFSGRATGTRLAIGDKELLKQDGSHGSVDQTVKPARAQNLICDGAPALDQHR